MKFAVEGGQVLDRGMPVARLVPAAAGNDPKALDRLVSRGLIRFGKGDPAAVVKEPPLELPVSILDTLLKTGATGCEVLGRVRLLPPFSNLRCQL